MNRRKLLLNWVRKPITSEFYLAESGLLVSDDFSSIADWGNEGTWVSTAVAILSAYPIPRYLLEATPSSSDANGVRESHMVSLNNNFYLFYGAGDGDASPNGPWMVHLARSSDWGKTWTKLGVQVDLSKDFMAGDWAGRDMGFVYRDGGTYYLHVVDAENASANVPETPYEESVYTSNNIEGPWVYSNRGPLPRGSAGDFDDRSICGPSVVLDAGTYHEFYSGLSSIAPGGIGRATSGFPIGPWVKQGEQIAGYIENPKVFYSTYLGLWVMLVNHIDNPGGLFTDKNQFYTSTLLNNWGGAGTLNFQFHKLLGYGTTVGTIACDIDTTQGDVVGLASPLYLESGLPAFDEDMIPFTYDGYPTDTNHNGRRILGGVLEPSRFAIYFTGAATRTIQRLIYHTDIVAEFNIFITAQTNANAQINFAYRRDSIVGTTVNGYQVAFIPFPAANASVSLGVFIAGVYTNIITNTIMKPVLGQPYRIRIECVGTNHKVYINGVLIINQTNATFASGATIAFRGYETTCYVWNFHTRKSNTVTVIDAPSAVSMHSPGNIYVTEHQSAIVHTHYPMRMLKIGDIETSFPAGIYGGDVYEIV